MDRYSPHDPARSTTDPHRHGPARGDHPVRGRLWHHPAVRRRHRAGIGHPVDLADQLVRPVAVDRGAEPDQHADPGPGHLRAQRQGRRQERQGEHRDSGSRPPTARSAQVKLTYKGTDAKGKAIKGEVDGTLTKDKTGWTAAERLEPGGDVHADRQREEPAGRGEHHQVHVQDAGPDPAAADVRPAAAAEGQQRRRRDAGDPPARRAGEEPEGVREAPAR